MPGWQSGPDETGLFGRVISTVTALRVGTHAIEAYLVTFADGSRAFPGEAGSGFVQRYRDFMRVQLSVVQPRLAIPDNAGEALKANAHFAELPHSVVVAALHHPANGRPNVKRRRSSPANRCPQATALVLAESGNLSVSLIGTNQMAVLGETGLQHNRPRTSGVADGL